MRLILGLDAPDSGKALVNGKRYREHSAPLAEVGGSARGALESTLADPRISTCSRLRKHMEWDAHECAS
jgi:hypothetical protein